MTFMLNLGKVRNVLGASQNYQFSVDSFDFKSKEWQLDGPMEAAFTITNEGKDLLLEGVVKGKVKSHCDRCLKPVVHSVEVKITEHLLYQKDAVLFSHLAVGELEELYYLYDSDDFSADDLVRENILAELPLKVLCSENCQGLCLKCGQNLNEGQCQCSDDEIDPRLAILAKLKTAEEV